MAKRELSSTLKNLKFMQRASPKVDKVEEEQVMPAADAPSSSAPKRCVVIVEGEPHPGAARGRMSFLSFNPSIDKLNEEASDHSQNGSIATTSGSQTKTSIRENESPEDSASINGVDLKRKQTDFASEPPHPTKVWKESQDNQHSSPSGQHKSQKKHKREKLDWNILRSKPQSKKR